MPLHVITANRLTDGAVIWQGSGSGWTARFAEASAIADAGLLAARLEDAKRLEAAGRVIGVYEIEVEGTGSEFTPLRLRERIRAAGPTVAFG